EAVARRRQPQDPIKPPPAVTARASGRADPSQSNCHSETAIMRRRSNVFPTIWWQRHAYITICRAERIPIHDESAIRPRFVRDSFAVPEWGLNLPPQALHCDTELAHVPAKWLPVRRQGHARMTEHVPANACPVPDPGWLPARRQGRAPTYRRGADGARRQDP